MRDLRDNSSWSSATLLYVKEYQNNQFLSFLYENNLGQKLLPLITSKGLTTLMGKFYDSKLSKKIIPGFIKKNQMDMKPYKKKEYTSFNDFFTREKKKIVFSNHSGDFCSPCDAYLSAYRINFQSKFNIKGLTYSLEDLILNHGLAKEYNDGLLYVFRLIPTHYHRYHYFDDGKLLFSKKIKGAFHTVRDVALKKMHVYLENTREYSFLETKNFKDVFFIEVGALGVGKIANHYQKEFKRGEEKGMFFFGGSTVILCFMKDTLKEPVKLLEKSLNGEEAVVKCGQKIGELR